MDIFADTEDGRLLSDRYAGMLIVKKRGGYVHGFLQLFDDYTMIGIKRS